MSGPGALWDLLALPASLDPDRPILSFDGETLTFAEVVEWTLQIAERLDGEPVALLDVNSHHSLLLMYACFFRGSRFIPLNYRLRAHELNDILQRAGTRRLVFGERYRPVAESVAAGAWGGETIEIGELCARDPAPAAPPVALSPDAGAGDIVLFTSGTSSAPKPIPLDAAPLSAYVMATTPACPPSTREESLLMSMPLYHVAGIVAILRAVFSGRRVAVLDQFDPLGWIEAVEKYQITHAFLVPTMMQRVLDADADKVGRLSSLQVVTYGGGPMPATTIGAALEAFPDSVGFVGVYGLTEASGTVCILDEADHDAARRGDEGSLERLGSVGRPLDDLVVEIQDEEQRPLGPGEVGEIVIRGRRLTSALAGGGEGGPRELRTGDLGYRDEDGYLHFRGRADDMIVRGGENIAPKEIEEILRASEQVAECAVLGVPDEEWGQRIAAVVVPADPASGLDLDALREESRALLAGYKWPGEFVEVEDLPMTPTGKVIKRELLGLLGSG